MVKMTTVIMEPKNLSGEVSRLSHCKCAAQDVTAGAVKARKPPMTPIRNAKRRT
jgi:hypothetical protein